MRPDIGNFTQTLRRQTGTFVPLGELGVHPLIKGQLIGRPIVTLADEVEFWLRGGYDYVKLQPKADFDPGRRGPTTNVTLSLDGAVSRRWASEGKGAITTHDDFDHYLFPSQNDFDYSPFETIRHLLPDGMGVIGQYGDIFTMTWELMGFEAFSMAIFDQPDLVEQVNTTVGNLVVSMFEYFADSDAVDVLWYSDDIAYNQGPMVSPSALRTYFFPWLRKIGDLAKSHEKPLIYHTDGAILTLLPEIIDCGVDAIHPIDPKAMSLEEVKKGFGDRLCLIGNVDVDLLARGEPEQIRALVRRSIEVAGKGGGYIVGSGNSIPEYVAIENYRAMIQAAQEFGES
jgi:uroporphyrinogen decarboxylase